MATFIVFFKDGTRRTVSTRHDEDDEYELDAAWEEMYMDYPEADYIDLF